LSKSGGFARGSHYYARRKPLRPPSGRSFLLVTEGEKTEPNYFVALRNKLKLTSVDVEIVHPEGTDPITLAEHAIELRERRRIAARQGEHIPYDEIWIIFDLEKRGDIRREQAERARHLKGAEGIRFARSDPAFEYWLILHFEYTTAPLANADEAVRRLRRSWTDYEKCCIPQDELFSMTVTAANNAKRCREHHERGGGDGNPSTEIDLIVRNLNEATRLHNRLLIV
jgi:hypothetical protein